MAYVIDEKLLWHDILKIIIANEQDDLFTKWPLENIWQRFKQNSMNKEIHDSLKSIPILPIITNYLLYN